MASELNVATMAPAFTSRVLHHAQFRIHRVTCPKCGRIVWFTLFSERTPEEVDWASQEQEQRLLNEPCERHRK